MADNVATSQANMPWYGGSSLAYLLVENIHVSGDENLIDCRFPVQYIIRPMNDEYHDYRDMQVKLLVNFKKGIALWRSVRICF